MTQPTVLYRKLLNEKYSTSVKDDLNDIVIGRKASRKSLQPFSFNNFIYVGIDEKKKINGILYFFFIFIFTSVK